MSHIILFILKKFFECRKISYDKIPDFTKIQNTKWGLVIDVYDGDTFTIVCFNGFRLVRRKVRILYIDAPEIRQSSNMDPDKRQELKSQAVASRDYLIDIIKNKIVKLRCTGTCKYGRILADISIKGENLSDLLVLQGHAVYKNYA